MEKVSIITPYYFGWQESNGETWLSQSLQASLHQTIAPLEVLVGSDGPDHAAEFDKSLSAFNPHIVRSFMLQPWVGHPNEVIKHAAKEADSHAEYLAVIDDDDIAAPTLIQDSLRSFDQSNSVIGTYGATIRMDREGFILALSPAPRFDDCDYEHTNFIPGNALIRADIMRDTRFLELGESSNLNQKYSKWRRQFPMLNYGTFTLIEETDPTIISLWQKKQPLGDYPLPVCPRFTLLYRATDGLSAQDQLLAEDGIQRPANPVHYTTYLASPDDTLKALLRRDDIPILMPQRYWDPVRLASLTQTNNHNL